MCGQISPTEPTLIVKKLCFYELSSLHFLLIICSRHTKCRFFPKTDIHIIIEKSFFQFQNVKLHPHKVTDKSTLKTFCISVFLIVLSIRIWMNFWFCLILVFFAKKKYQSVIGKNYKIDSPMILLAIFFVTFFSFFPFFLKCSESKKIKTIIVKTILKNPWIFAFGWIWRFSPSYIRLSLKRVCTRTAILQILIDKSKNKVKFTVRVHIFFE